MRLNYVQDAYSLALYEANPKPLESLILGNSSFTTAARVAVYQNNVLGSLKNALRAVYPVTQEIVGSRYFNQLINTHVKQYPSADRNLDLYGKSFPDTLKQLINEREELEQIEYLADVARLEWALHQSYYARDRGIFDIEGFSLLTAHQQLQACFTLADDLTFLESPFPVDEIWQLHQQSGEKSMSTVIVGGQQSHYLLVQREKWKPHIQVISKSLFKLFSAIQSGNPLLELTTFLENPEEEMVDIAALIQQGLIIGYKTAS